MKIKINGNWRELKQGSQLYVLLKELLIDQKGGVAVAVNATVIQRKDWSQYELHENDEVIIIEAAQGG